MFADGTNAPREMELGHAGAPFQQDLSNVEQKAPDCRTLKNRLASVTDLSRNPSGVP